MFVRRALVFVFGGAAASPFVLDVHVDGARALFRTLEAYVSVVMDWWIDDGAEGGSWAQASVLTADLAHPRLRAAAKRLSPGLLRIGGSMDVEARYAFSEADVGWCREPRPFRGANVSLCLDAARYDEVHAFAAAAGLRIVWGLNYPGAYATSDGDGRVGDSPDVPEWNATSALALLAHSAASGQALFAVEVAEELVPPPGSTSFAHLVAAYRRARDAVDGLWPDEASRPLILGPCVGMAAETDGDAACDPTCDPSPFLDAFLDEALGFVDALCMHSYNNDGPWPKPGFVSQTRRQHAALSAATRRRDPTKQVWCGECGPHNGGGLANVTDTFASIFWYADALGSLAAQGAPEFGRQALLGGNYALLDAARGYAPNPDFYVAQLWTATMGPAVLRATVRGAGTTGTTGPAAHAYAHCAPGGGASLAVVNPQNRSATLRVAFSPAEPGSTARRDEWVLSGREGAPRDVWLNGASLAPPPDGLPDLPPARRQGGALVVPPASVAFVRYPDLALPACAEALPRGGAES